MKITVKATGLLVEHLPEGASGNTAEIEVGDGASPLDVIEALGLPGDRSYLVAVNGEVVPEKDRAGHTLASGDTVAVMPPLRGG